jgi:hypothetical protein
MNNTVMPMIKEQLKELQRSSILVVYHSKNMTRCYRSYMAPSSVRPTIVGFGQPHPDATDPAVTMTYSYGEGDQASFGSHVIDDALFIGVPFFELRAELVITTFNELFIGTSLSLQC